MKKTPIFLLLLALVFLQACKTDYTSKPYLEKVLSNLEQIKSATYMVEAQGWAPFDTAAYVTHYNYVKEYTNPEDTTIGASYVSLLQSDTTQMVFCYDGNRRAVVYEDSKHIVIDSFNIRKLTFRPVNAPFFNYTKNIIKYALETNDSTTLEMEDLGDIVYFKLEIFENKQVEFHGKANYNVNPFGYGDDISRYDIWIRKSTGLPFKVFREQSHDISIRICSNVELNKIDIKDFVPTDYFQADYKLVPYRLGRPTKKSEFLGKKAPDWVLKDADNNSVALKNLKSKVLLIQFTSVSCGPCKASIPFVKQLVTEYDRADFDFVAIEAFAKNSNVLKHYQQRNDFDYKFLMSNKNLNLLYQIQAVPVFFILDENRIIREVISGYSKGSVDQIIREKINNLIY